MFNLTDEHAALDGVPTELLIDGAWIAAASGARLDVEDPSTAEPLAEVADAGPGDAVRALQVAHRRFRDFSRTSPQARADILRRAHEIVAARRENLALIMTLEMGKPLAESRAEIDYAASFLRWFSEEAVRPAGHFGLAPDGDSRIVVTRQAIGPCLLITPWNFPAAMVTRKVGAAIAAGCSMVLKPAPQTPLTALAIGKILLEAGLPDGVLNIITTSDANATMTPLLADGHLRKLSFTGSTEVGRLLLERAAAHVLSTSMELGGNAPFIVFADADLDAAVDGAVIAKMRNGGEACTAANRFYVQRPILAEFTERLTQRVSAMRVGRGVDPDTEVGPLIDARQLDKVASLVDAAVKGGARLANGGDRLERSPGHFYTPTVLTEVPSDARLLQEEIFGPVAPIMSFDSEPEVVEQANATHHGLVAYLYTRELNRAFRVADDLESGMVGVNRGLVSNAAAPFGGARESGLGREGGREGIDAYLEIKYLALAT